MTGLGAAGQVTAVCILHTLRPEFSNPDKLTAIDKRVVDGAVHAGRLGLVGDVQKDTRHHGGVNQALYAYADEDAAWWASELGREITPGLFGENLRTAGVDVTGAEIGEQWRIGTGGLVVEVTDPRRPCGTFQRRMGVEQWVRRFADHGAVGAYLKVVTEGRVASGDPLEIVHRPGTGVTIGSVFAAG